MRARVTTALGAHGIPLGNREISGGLWRRRESNPRNVPHGRLPPVVAPREQPGATQPRAPGRRGGPPPRGLPTGLTATASTRDTARRPSSRAARSRQRPGAQLVERVPGSRPRPFASSICAALGLVPGSRQARQRCGVPRRRWRRRFRCANSNSTPHSEQGTVSEGVSLVATLPSLSPSTYRVLS